MTKMSILQWNPEILCLACDTQLQRNDMNSTRRRKFRNLFDLNYPSEINFFPEIFYILLDSIFAIACVINHPGRENCLKYF